MDDDKLMPAILFGVLWFAVAPLVVLLGPALLIGTGTMDESINYFEGTHEVSGFMNAFGRVYGEAYSAVVPMLLLHVAGLVALALRFRAPLGGGNAAGSGILLSVAASHVIASGIGSSNELEGFGVYLILFFLALPGAVVAAVALSSWGRRLIAGPEHFDAKASKDKAAESGYME